MNQTVELKTIYQETLRHFLGPIAGLLDDPGVSEVMINGPEAVYFERAGRIEKADVRFRDEGALRAAALNVAEYVDRPLDPDHPTLDARLPDGSRVNVLLPPGSRQGTCISIRKFLAAHFSLAAMVERGTLGADAAEFLEIAVRLHKNILISGGTGSGKTTLLNALSGAIPETERIIVIEDSSELRLHQPHTLYLEAQPPRPDGRGALTIRDLFVNSLRMRPDRVIVGEVRRGEALDLVQSMISGHAGSLATVHASDPHTAALRLELLCLMNDAKLPIPVVRSQIAAALDLVVQVARDAEGVRRVVTIAELDGLDASGAYVVRDLFQLGPGGDDGPILAPTGREPRFAAESAAVRHGAPLHPPTFP
ncbi:MAG: CpaF family protein [Isosphaeraceae bacterium]